MSDAELRLLALEARITGLLAALDAALARLAAAEQTSWASGGGGSGANLLLGVYPATNGGSPIAAKAAGVAGSGTVTLKEIDPATGNVTSGDSVTAWNFWPSSVPASRDLTVGRYLNADGVEMWLCGPVSCT